MTSLIFNSGKGGIEFLIGISICRVVVEFHRHSSACVVWEGMLLMGCAPALQHILCFVSTGQKEGIICNTHPSDLGESLFHS